MPAPVLNVGDTGAEVAFPETELSDAETDDTLEADTEPVIEADLDSELDEREIEGTELGDTEVIGLVNDSEREEEGRADEDGTGLTKLLLALAAEESTLEGAATTAVTSTAL